MPQHKSAAKRVRQSETRRLRNRIHRSRMRSMMTNLRETEDPVEAQVQLKETKAYLDRMVNKNILNKKRAANYKSALEKTVNSLS
ncbi:MAG: 30S ribosomal protein S20 [Rhodothermia bacterium]|nr:MAG: 30S ribosomal protein S20 [Rhodothermia bacterium]